MPLGGAMSRMCPKSTWMIWHCSLKQQKAPCLLLSLFSLGLGKASLRGLLQRKQIVKIGQGRKAQLKGDERRYSLVQKSGAKAQPKEPLPRREDDAEASPAAKRAAKSQRQPSKRRKPGVQVD